MRLIYMLPMTRLKAADQTPPSNLELKERGRRGASAADACYVWLKEWVAAVPRDASAVITEAEVSAATNLGRTPAREALLRMDAEGFLKIVARKGAFVTPVSDPDIEAIMQARVLIETWCLRHAKGDLGQLLSRLESLLVEQEQLGEDSAAFIERDREFHRAIVRAAGNFVLANFYEILRDRQVRIGLLALGAVADRRRQVIGEHAAIVDAIRAGDPSAAASALATHLANTQSVLTAQPIVWDPEEPKEAE